MRGAARCERAFRSRGGTVRGWVGRRAVAGDFARTAAGRWRIGRRAAARAVDGFADLDFGFTPATNLAQLRRLRLAIGQAADAPAAWFDLSSRDLVPLPQRYERRTATRYRYASPTTGYAATLDVDASGCVLRYPGLWQAVG